MYYFKNKIHLQGHLTFDSEHVGELGGLAGNSVEHLARVHSSVLVTSLLNGIRLRCDTSQCVVKPPGEAAGGYGLSIAGEFHRVVHLYGLVTLHRHLFRSVWR